MTTIYSQRLRKLRKLLLMAFTVCLMGLVGSSCKKDSAYDGHPATFQLFNALNDNVFLYANLSGKHLTSYQWVPFVKNKDFTIWNNQYITQLPQSLDLYAHPDTLPHHRPIISTTLEGKNGSIYSMFIYGDKANPDFLIREDHFPAPDFSDSSAYIRFANFSDGPAISVNLKGNANGSFVDNLPFKSFSDFQTLPITRAINRQELEIREQATGNLLFTYLTPIWDYTFLNSNSWIYKPVTLVFTGMPGGTGTNERKVAVMAHRGQ